MPGCTLPTCTSTSSPQSTNGLPGRCIDETPSLDRYVGRCRTCPIVCSKIRPAACAPEAGRCHMELAAQIMVGVVAAIHVYILVLEMFLWRTDRVRGAFGTT